MVDARPEDNSSVICQALGSNAYRLALLKNNYLDCNLDSKGLSHSDLNNVGGKQPKYLPANLYHKEDIFNYELKPQKMEQEMLRNENQKLSFTFNFCNYSPESTLAMQNQSTD